MQRRSSARLLTLVATVLAIGVAGCGSDDGSADSDSTSSHNSADVAFATDMIAHHSQAIEMADMALTRTEDTAVIDLAGQIKAAQDPEIEAMSGWLEAWGEEVPDLGDDMSGMDHDMSGMDDSMPGMMSEADMQSLANSSGAAFDRMWLTMMIEHHEGAISMAETELSDGESAEAKSLADDIIEGQQAEVTTMQGLLDDLGE
ncbi:MAG: DUF305 domain-containing protein [Actinomycetota bacterium]|nr:DUF305 domain-containing protein [Actinomycetota bacterium]